ncbi:MAG: hypothetical protein OHK0039_12170 [Bacteroidia bacterium]
MPRILFLVAITLYAPKLSAQEAPVVRSFPAAELDSVRQLRSFRYGLQPLPEDPEIPDLLSPFWLQFWEFFMYFVIGTFAVVLIYLVLRNTLLMPARRTREVLAVQDIDQADIRTLDFDTLIRQAVEAADYRLAVRLHYLHVLQRLSARHQIDWKPYKTNQDYLDELKDSSLHRDFRQLTRTYDYVWYGHFGVDADHYGRLAAAFGQFGSSTPARA